MEHAQYPHEAPSDSHTFFGRCFWDLVGFLCCWLMVQHRIRAVSGTSSSPEEKQGTQYCSLRGVPCASSLGHTGRAGLCHCTAQSKHRAGQSRGGACAARTQGTVSLSEAIQAGLGGQDRGSLTSAQSALSASVRNKPAVLR